MNICALKIYFLKIYFLKKIINKRKIVKSQKMSVIMDKGTFCLICLGNYAFFSTFVEIF